MKKEKTVKKISYSKASSSYKFEKELVPAIFLAALSGILLIAALPEGLHFFFAWFALTPLVLLTTGKISPIKAFFLTFLAGLIYTLKLYHSINLFGLAPWIFLSALQASLIALWGTAVNIASNRIQIPDKWKIVLPPLLWLIYEYLRGCGVLAVNWGSLAYTQYKFLPFIQLASITGTYGLLFLIILCNSIMAFWIRELLLLKKKSSEISVSLKKYTVIFIISFTLIILWGMMQINLDEQKAVSAKKLKFSLIQPAIPMKIKTNPYASESITSLLMNMTIAEAFKKPDIIFWPETAMPGRLPDDPQAMAKLSSLVKGCGCDLVVGACHKDEKDCFYNCALHFDNQGVFRNYYAKRHLVPFAEYLPLPQSMRKYKIFDRVMNYCKGRESRLFSTKGISYGILICFESDFSQYFRESAKKGAQFISVITNDGWFERYPTAEHHISWDVFRAVENHINIIQTANTGISALIDYNGRIRERRELFVQTTLNSQMDLLSAGTFYTRYGNVFFVLAVALLLYILIISILPEFAGKKEADQ